MRSFGSFFCGLYALTIVLAGMVGPASAQGRFRAKDGLYLTANMAYNNVWGNFDGETILTNPDQVVLIPEVDGDLGFGIGFGRRFDQGAVELTYVRSRHDASFIGVPMKVTFNAVNLDGKIFFMTRQPLQPHLRLGMAIPWLVVEEGSSDGVVFTDATLFGLGLNIGGGLTYYLDPRVFISLDVVYHAIWYTSVDGAAGRARIDGTLDGNSLTLGAGMGFTF